MSGDRFKLIPAVHLILIRQKEVLLLRRFNTGYEDGNYSLIAGHIDGNEKATTAMAREALEEAGIVIKTNDLDFAHVMHRMAEEERIDFFFTAKTWSGKLVNKEPNKCDDLSWFPINQLPDNIIPYVKSAIICYDRKIAYSEFNWQRRRLSRH